MVVNQPTNFHLLLPVRPGSASNEAQIGFRRLPIQCRRLPVDIPAIAARLGVDHILEGSIRTAGQQVRVTAQLIEVSNDVHLWSEAYDGSLDDIFKIQDEITSQITAALKIQLGSEGLAPASDLLTNNAEAYQLYLQGRHLWRQRNSAENASEGFDR